VMLTDANPMPAVTANANGISRRMRLPASFRPGERRENVLPKLCRNFLPAWGHFQPFPAVSVLGILAENKG
jgi:hypothetical protein